MGTKAKHEEAAKCENVAWFGGGPDCPSKGPFRKVRATANGMERDLLLCYPDAVWIENWSDEEGRISAKGLRLFRRAQEQAK